MRMPDTAKRMLYILCPLVLLFISCKDNNPDIPDRDGEIENEPVTQIYINEEYKINESLPGTVWKLMAFIDEPSGEITLPVREDCESCYQLAFNENGTFTGYTSCNTITGDYEFEPEKGLLKIPSLGGTEVYDSLLEDTKFQQILKGISIYEMSEEILKVYNSESGMMQFKRHID